MSTEFRTRFKRILDEIGLPDPFDLGEFIHRVETYRQRPIHVLTVPGLRANRCLCAETDRGDVILVSEAASPLHHLTVVCHEIAHLLAGHPPDRELARVLGDLPPKVMTPRIQGILTRQHFSTVEEQEAETGATMIVSRALYTEVVPPMWGDLEARREAADDLYRPGGH